MLKNLESQIKSLEEKTSSLKGKVQILEEQYNSSQEKIISLKKSQDTNKKAINLLDFVQGATKESTKRIFEGVITNALRFIYQTDEYDFELEFSKRGNIPELKFNLKKPEMQDFHDIMSTSAGGNRDIVALALREVLLETFKISGFLLLDEPFKRLDNSETINKAMEFIKKLQEKTGRQILIISHKQEVIDSVPDPIIMSKSKILEKIEDKKPKLLKKKRGRKKKEEI